MRAIVIADQQCFKRWASLEQAREERAVRIRRRDGLSFMITPEPILRSPLDIAGVDLGVTTEEIVAFIHELTETFLDRQTQLKTGRGWRRYGAAIPRSQHIRARPVTPTLPSRLRHGWLAGSLATYSPVTSVDDCPTRLAR